MLNRGGVRDSTELDLDHSMATDFDWDQWFEDWPALEVHGTTIPSPVISQDDTNLDKRFINSPGPSNGKNFPETQNSGASIECPNDHNLSNMLTDPQISSGVFNDLDNTGDLDLSNVPNLPEDIMELFNLGDLADNSLPDVQTTEQDQAPVTLPQIPEAAGESLEGGNFPLQQRRVSFQHGLQPSSSKSTPPISSSTRVNLMSKELRLPLLPRPPTTRTQQLSSPSGPLMQTSLDSAAQSRSSNALRHPVIITRKRKNHEDHEAFYGPTAKGKRREVAAGVPARYCFSFALRPNPIPKKKHAKRGKRSCLRCSEQKLKCTGGFPCTNCQRVLSNAIARRSRQSLLWSGCIDSDIMELNIFVLALAGQQISPFKFSSQQFGHLSRMVLDLQSMAQAALTLSLEELHDGFTEIGMLCGYDMSTCHMPPPQYPPHGSAGRGVDIKSAFMALCIHGPVIYKKLGLTEQQGRRVSAAFSILFFKELKKSVTLARTKHMRHQEKLNLLSDLVSLLELLAEALCSRFILDDYNEMTTHLIGYAKYFIMKLIRELDEAALLCIDIWIKFVRRFICMDLSGWDDEDLEDTE